MPKITQSARAPLQMGFIPIQGREGADSVVVVQLLFLVGRISVKSII
jgi:hypothetical protein